MGTQGGLTCRLAMAIFSATLGMLNFGYNTGVINAPQKVIEAFYNQTFVERTGAPIPGGILTFLWSFTVAIFAVGGLIGGVLGAWWANKFGRKNGMLINALFGVVAAALMGFSLLAKSYEMLIVGRFIVGFNCGLYTGLTPIYNSEIAPANLRGAVGTVNQLGATIGILSSNVLGLTEILGNDRLWAVLLGLTVIPPALQLLTLPLSPESPRYLLLVQKREDAAVDALSILRNTDDVRDEIAEIRAEGETQQEEEQMSIIQVLRSSSLRLPLIISVVMHLSQQFSGINCVFYYSTSLFQNVGLEPQIAKYATLCVGCIMVTMTLVTIPLMDRAGRRTLHLTGLAGMFVFSILFTIFFAVSQNKVQWIQYASVACALIFVVFFALGPGSIPWMIVAELFSQGPRPAAVGIGVFVNWLSNFIVGQTFPPLQGALKQYVFLPFTVLLALFFIFIFKFLPETKNKTIEEITVIFTKKRKQVNNGSQEAILPRGGAQGSYKTIDENDRTRRVEIRDTEDE